MQQNFTLYTSIFNKDVQQNEIDLNLKDVCTEYPYFSVAQFFILQQTPTNTAAYTKQLHKTALLFNNNFWLQYQLNQPQKSVSELDNSNLTKEILLKSNENIVPIIQLVDDDSRAPEALNIMDEGMQPAIVTTLEEISIAADEEDELIEVHENENIIFNSNIKQVLESVVANIPNKNTVIATELATNDTMATNDTPLFEPLHTTDYFASVGIKMSDENKPNDKLGKQLKSFTAWLKTMKKIHVIEDCNLSNATDVNIQILADASNMEANVVTEAMANILIQQGSIKKAIEVLEKLSLLNPAKTAYFAAQINQLKES